MDKNAIAVNTYNHIARIYSDKYFEDASDTIYIKKLLSLLPPGSKILDVGCGPGQFSKYMAESGYQVEGVDLSEEMIKIAKQKVPDVNFKQMDMRKLEYSEGSFDAILCAYSLIHIQTDQIDDTLRDFYRVLNPNGKLLLITQAGEPDKIVDQPLKAGFQTFINFFKKEKIASTLINLRFGILWQTEIVTKDTDSLSDKIIYTLAKKSN